MEAPCRSTPRPASFSTRSPRRAAWSCTSSRRADARKAFEKLRLPVPGEPVAHVENRTIPGPAGRDAGARLRAGGRRDARPRARLLPRRRLGDRRPRVARQLLPRAREPHATPSSCRWTTGSRPSTAFPPRPRTATPRRVGSPSTAPRSASTAARIAVGGRQRGRQPRRGRRADGARSRRAALRHQVLVYPVTDHDFETRVVPRQRRRLPAHARDACSGSGTTTSRTRRSAARRTPRRCAPRSSRAAARDRDHRRVRPAARRRRGLRARACARPASPPSRRATTARSTASSACSRSSTRASWRSSRSPRRCARRSRSLG